MTRLIKERERERESLITRQQIFQQVRYTKSSTAPLGEGEGHMTEPCFRLLFKNLFGQGQVSLNAYSLPMA